MSFVACTTPTDFKRVGGTPLGGGSYPSPSFSSFSTFPPSSLPSLLPLPPLSLPLLFILIIHLITFMYAGLCHLVADCKNFEETVKANEEITNSPRTPETNHIDLLVGDVSSREKERGRDGRRGRE